jgi:hypothetical protein
MRSLNLHSTGLLFSLLASAAAVGCSDEATVVRAPGTPETPGTPEAPGPGAPEPEDAPAVMVAGLVPGVDGYTLYVAAFPELPTGDVGYSTFREFSGTDTYVYAAGGYIFFWDGGARQMTRFSVDAEYNLVEGPTVSFANEVPGAGNHVFISPTRAYSLSTDLDGVVVWNPETMTITGRIPMELPERPGAMTSFAYYAPGTVAGDRVVWEIVTADSDNIIAYPATTLAVASTESEEPVQFIEDDRCVGGGGGYADAQGNFFVRAGALWGQFAAFGEAASTVRTCMLRLNAGETSFDPDFMLDFQNVTGSYVNYPWFHVADDQYLALAWDPARPLPTIDEFYLPDTTALFRPLLIDVEAGSAAPYPDLAGGKFISSDEFKIDGVSYYQFSQTGYVDGGSTDVVELRPEGIVQRFHVPGSLWALARVR